jgi:hypothetical protein
MEDREQKSVFGNFSVVDGKDRGPPLVRKVHQYMASCTSTDLHEGGFQEGRADQAQIRFKISHLPWCRAERKVLLEKSHQDFFARDIRHLQKSHRSELDNKICVLYSSFTPVVMARRDICLATRRYLSLNYCEKGFLIGALFAVSGPA